MKRRAAVIAIATGLATASGALLADAQADSPAVARDSSGCVVVRFYDTVKPVYLCLFPR